MLDARLVEDQTPLDELAVRGDLVAMPGIRDAHIHLRHAPH